jgi:hypothetical protein
VDSQNKKLTVMFNLKFADQEFSLNSYPQQPCLMAIQPCENAYARPLVPNALPARAAYLSLCLSRLLPAPVIRASSGKSILTCGAGERI